MKKDLLKLLDLTREDITKILNVADQMKYNQKHGLTHNYLQGKTLAMIFEKSSTRTRVSFEVGMYQLGGHALFLSGKESQIGRGEPIEDTARVLSRYCDGIMIRTYGQDEVEELARKLCPAASTSTATLSYTALAIWLATNRLHTKR